MTVMTACGFVLQTCGDGHADRTNAQAGRGGGFRDGRRGAQLEGIDLPAKNPIHIAESRCRPPGRV